MEVIKMTIKVIRDKETFFDKIGGQYIYPKNEVVSTLLKSDEELNKTLKINGKITYKEYFDILDKYFNNVNHPWYYYQISLDMIPVKMFYWDYTNYFDTPNKDEWTSKNQYYSWSLYYA
jgi:hypothetical protein